MELCGLFKNYFFDCFYIYLRIPFPAKNPSNRLLVYWLPKSECRIIPSVCLTFRQAFLIASNSSSVGITYNLTTVQIHYGCQIRPPFFQLVDVGDVAV